MTETFSSALWDAFINFLYRRNSIEVPAEFHQRCDSIKAMLGNDITGVIGTILDYSVNSASEATYQVECADDTTENLLNLWLNNVNLTIPGIPTGLQPLAKEYFKERWEGSSLCLLRVSNWKEIALNGIKIKVPTIMWFVNGNSVYVDRMTEDDYKLGTDKYYLDRNKKIKIPKDKDEQIVVQKPYDRWFDKYSTPYCIRKGIYKNFKAIEVLQEKGDEVITKVLPYLVLLTKGDKDLFIQKNVKYNDDDLLEMTERLKVALEQYNHQTGKTPFQAQPFDQKMEHFLPDLRNILTEELYRQGYRTLLSGLGFVDVIQGISSTRKESVLNPKPFIAEVNSGVDGFKEMLVEVIKLIIKENKIDHRKLFSDKNKLHIVNSPLKINVENILDQIRSSFVYGVTSIKTYQEVLGLDPETEFERMQKEQDEGLREIFYPHLIQNREDIPDSVTPITKKQNEKQQEKEKQPEHMEEANIDDKLEIAPYTKDNYPKYLDKYPEEARKVWIETFNNVYKRTKGDESKAFPIAWNAMKRWLKKHGYVNKGTEWVNKAEMRSEEIQEKQNKLLDKLLGEKDEDIQG